MTSRGLSEVMASSSNGGQSTLTSGRRMFPVWVRMPMSAVKASQGLPFARNCRRTSENALPVTLSCRSLAPAIASGWPPTNS